MRRKQDTSGMCGVRHDDDDNEAVAKLFDEIKDCKKRFVVVVGTSNNKRKIQREQQAKMSLAVDIFLFVGCLCVSPRLMF